MGIAMATPILPLVDRILGGRTSQILQRYRDEGLSNEAIARRLVLDHDIDVTAETVRKWCAELDVTAKAS